MDIDPWRVTILLAFTSHNSSTVESYTYSKNADKFVKITTECVKRAGFEDQQVEATCNEQTASITFFALKKHKTG